MAVLQRCSPAYGAADKKPISQPATHHHILPALQPAGQPKAVGEACTICCWLSKESGGIRTPLWALRSGCDKA